MQRVVKFITLGCKVNQYETNAMAQKFLEKGYKVIEEEKEQNEEKLDICIINTCTVTNMSDRKSRQMLRREKENNEKVIVVAVGCYAQVAKEELKKIPCKIGVASGLEKKEALHGALLGGYIDILYADEELGKEILNY